MKDTIRCCISCILPCGALDVIRIVHSNGRVEEISGSISAAEIMRLHPKHVLKKPSSPDSDMCHPKIVILPPDAELQRGKIYFLMPAPPSNSSSTSGKTTRSKTSSASKRKKKLQTEFGNVNNNNNRNNNGNSNSNSNSNNNDDGSSLTNSLLSDRYLTEIMSEKVSTQRDRRRGRVGVWRPHLESISETPILDG